MPSCPASSPPSHEGSPPPITTYNRITTAYPHFMMCITHATSHSRNPTNLTPFPTPHTLTRQPKPYTQNPRRDSILALPFWGCWATTDHRITTAYYHQPSHHQHLSLPTIAPPTPITTFRRTTNTYHHLSSASTPPSSTPPSIRGLLYFFQGFVAYCPSFYVHC